MLKIILNQTLGYMFTFIQMGLCKIDFLSGCKIRERNYFSTKTNVKIDGFCSFDLILTLHPS